MDISVPENADLVIPDFLKIIPPPDHKPLSEANFAEDSLQDPASSKQK